MRGKKRNLNSEFGFKLQTERHTEPKPQQFMSKLMLTTADCVAQIKVYGTYVIIVVKICIHAIVHATRYYTRTCHLIAFELL